MKLLHFVGKHSFAALTILVVWGFLWVLPIRCYNLSEAMPAVFDVAFGKDRLLIFYAIALAPILILGAPLYELHLRYERHERASLEKRIREAADEVKSKS